MSIRTFDLFVAGKWLRGARTTEIRSPHDGEIVARVAEAGAEELEVAIASAAAAAPVFRRESAWRRAEGLRKIARGLEARASEVTEMIVAESGKPLQYARSEVQRGIETFAFAAEEASRLGGEVIPLDAARSGQGRTGITRRVARGAIAAITPFNFPLNLVAHKVAPALACGCPVVLKPAPETPATAMMLAEIVADSGTTAGALSVVPTDIETAQRLIVNPRLKTLSFTGSAEIGWKLKQLAAKKHVTLELGGNAAVIVEPDCDLERALPRLVMGAFAYSGQICISVQRILVDESIAETFLTRFVEATKRLAKSGDPRQEDVMVGPLIRTRDADRVMAWLDEAASGGARIVSGGGRSGDLIEPTIVVNVDRHMKLSCQELFGPVVVIQSYRGFDEALGVVNDSPYGLQCGVYSNDLRKVWRAFEELEVGAVIHNDVPVFRADHMPYGGVKDSGFGREGVRYAMEEMTDLRLLALNP